MAVIITHYPFSIHQLTLTFPTAPAAPMIIVFRADSDEAYLAPELFNRFREPERKSDESMAFYIWFLPPF